MSRAPWPAPNCLEFLTNEPQRLPAQAAHIRLRRWALPLFFALWTLFAGGVAWWLIQSAGAESVQPQLLFDSGQTSQIPVGEQIRRWLKIADLNFRGAYPWMLLAPYVIWLASRFLLERGRLRVSLPVHLVGCALFVAASHALTTHVVEKMNVVMVLADRRQSTMLPSAPFTAEPAEILAKPSGDDLVRIHITNWNSKAATTMPPSREKFVERFIGSHGAAGFSSLSSTWRYESRLFSNLLNVLAYGSLAGLAHAVYFYRRFRERERRAVFLESHLAKARLHTLQAQLQPHFLFNALNAVATLLRTDARAAREALTSFSELLRLALSQSDKQEVSLSEDLRFVERYVEIQQTRLGDRFRFEQDVEPAALDCLVPALLLQPLVENALRHGLEPSSNPGMVRIVVKRLSDRLTVRIEDNGVGLCEAEDKVKTGIGLSNLRARLEALYGDHQKVELFSRPEGGVAVEIEIPLRAAVPEMP